MANSKKRFYILSVEPLTNNNKDYGFGLMKQDYNDLQIKESKIDQVLIELNGTDIIIDSSIGTYKKHRRLVNASTTKWVKSNNLTNTEKGEPAKLIFELTIDKNKHIYTLYKNQLNLK